MQQGSVRHGETRSRQDCLPQDLLQVHCVQQNSGVGGALLIHQIGETLAQQKTITATTKRPKIYCQSRAFINPIVYFDPEVLYSGQLSREKTFADCSLMLPMEAMSPNFVQKTFTNDHKFAKVFSLKSFLQYLINHHRSINQAFINPSFTLLLNY